MKSRQLVPELMDDPDLDRTSHVAALQGLRRINRWSGGAWFAWQPIRDLARLLDRDKLSVLDVATGAADMPLGLVRNASRHGLSLEIEACDVSPTALEFAAANLNRAGMSIPLFQLDALQDRIDRQYDVVLCSTFLHHLTDEQATELLRRMLAAARHRVIVVDLLRSVMHLWQVWLATRILSRSPVVHFDGPQSVRAAFTLPEIETVAERAELQIVSLRATWPCRFVLVGTHSP